MAEQSKFAGALARLNKRPAALSGEPPQVSNDSEVEPTAAKPTASKPLDQAEKAARAYARWQARGCPIGSPEEDWLEAEEELRAPEFDHPSEGVRPIEDVDTQEEIKNPKVKTKAATRIKMSADPVTAGYRGTPSTDSRAKAKTVADTAAVPKVAVPTAQLATLPDARLATQPMVEPSIDPIGEPAALPVAQPIAPRAAPPNAQTDAGADAIIRKDMLWAMGAGLVTIPWVDIAAITGVQLKMLNELADQYQVPFSKSRGKASIGALIGGVLPVRLGGGFLGGAFRMIPFVGVVTMPLFASATTYALGKVFAQHFASGGTFLDFSPGAVRRNFREQFENGKKVTANLAS
jgi:uncharacterized protein (DUF697 family)